MGSDIPDLEPLLKRLSLANTRRTYRELIRRAERESWSYPKFLSILVSEEIAHRRQTRINRLTRRAGFPFLKTLEEFDFSFQSTLRINLLGSAVLPDFITDGRTIIFIGKPGRGKTHLAVAISYKHIQNGFDVLFVTAAKMIDELSAAALEGRLSSVLTRYTHPALLVVDELGYLSYGNDAANMLFHVVNDRYLAARSMIFTTNKKLTDWGNVLHDSDLAAAIVDRLLERGRIIPLDGPSMRSRHLEVDPQTASMLPQQPDKVSGIDRTEFPEPTAFTPTNVKHGPASRSEPNASFSERLPVNLRWCSFLVVFPRTVPLPAIRDKPRREGVVARGTVRPEYAKTQRQH